MKHFWYAMLLLMVCAAAQAEEKWVDLIYENTLMGWKAAENPESFTIEDGVIICHGERAHLFYTGPISNHDFTNFELKAQVKTEPGSNSGIYFHTAYQASDWPSKGFEVQVNNSSDHEKRMTGSLYNMVDVFNVKSKDNEWFELHIIVKNKLVQIYVNGEPYVNFNEPNPPSPPSDMPGRVLSSGTFALQAHDPDSKVYYKEIQVKILDNE